MQAFMPQKDTALDLAKAAKSFIRAYNSCRQTVFPRFPLYAFADKLPEGGFSACTIRAPQQEDGSFFFPVEMTYAGGETLRLRIEFARLEGSWPDGRTTDGRTTEGSGQDSSRPDGNATAPLQELPQFEGQEKFPIRPRVFRTGRVEFKGSSWEVWEERWHKVSQLNTASH